MGNSGIVRGGVEAQKRRADIALNTKPRLESLLQQGRGESLRRFKCSQGTVELVLRGPMVVHGLFERHVLLAIGVGQPVGEVQSGGFQGVAPGTRGLAQPGWKAAVGANGHAASSVFKV